MTKKDYIALAGALQAARDLQEPSRVAQATITTVAVEMGRVFAQDNANFNLSRWYNAAIVEYKS